MRKKKKKLEDSKKKLNQIFSEMELALEEYDLEIKSNQREIDLMEISNIETYFFMKTKMEKDFLPPNKKDWKKRNLKVDNLFKQMNIEIAPYESDSLEAQQGKNIAFQILQKNQVLHEQYLEMVAFNEKLHAIMLSLVELRQRNFSNDRIL